MIWMLVTLVLVLAAALAGWALVVWLMNLVYDTWIWATGRRRW